jgi:hypothetical protein
MRSRSVLVLAAAIATAAMSLPSQAAAKGSTTLFFANEGGPGTGGCTPAYVLDKASTGNPCSSIQAGYSGKGSLGDDLFSSVKGAVGFKLDASKPLTGVVNIATYPIISGTPINTLPGMAGADIEVSINGTVIGTVSGSGQATAPNSVVSIPVSLKIPAKLNKVVVKSVDAHVTYKSAMGITGVDYSAENGSKLVFATTK